MFCDRLSWNSWISCLLHVPIQKPVKKVFGCLWQVYGTCLAERSCTYSNQCIYLNWKETKEHYRKCHHLNRLLHSQLQVKTFGSPPRQTTHHSLHLDTLCDWCWCGAIKAWAQNRLRVCDGFNVISHNPRETWHGLEFPKGVSSLGSNFWFQMSGVFMMPPSILIQDRDLTTCINGVLFGSFTLEMLRF